MKHEELMKDLKRQAILVQIVGDPDGADGLFAKAYEAMIDIQSRLESLEKDAARWNMFVTICSEAIMNPANRKHQRCMDAYTLAIGKGLDCVGAIDAAIDTAMQANKGE